MDLIAIDIGNTNIALAVFKNDELARTERLPLADAAPLPDIICSMRQFCGPQPLGAKTVPVVVSSVNPAGLDIVRRVVGDTLDQNLLVVGSDVPLFMKLALENPETVGSDRLLVASAAYDVIESAVVVASFGTATTVDCVSDLGIFLGGAIMPGLGLCARALNEHTAALPLVNPALPPGDLGANTEAAIQHGIYYGAIGALRELVERYATQLGHWPHVVITGGYARLIAERCDFIDSVVPNLCLSGLFLAYRRYRQAEDAGENA